MSRGYDDEAMKPLGPRLGLVPRPWWHKWVLLAIFAASAAVVPTLARLLGVSGFSGHVN
jgi:hypothetical protein